MERGRDKDMKRKITVLTLCALLFALCASAGAQQPKKVPRIGFLLAFSSSSYPERIEAFRQGLRELGYVEGQNVFVEYRYVGGKADESPSKLAAELVRLRVDLIVARLCRNKVTEGNGNEAIPL